MKPANATSGFTLIELLVVITILGIAVALLLPNLGSLRDDRDMQREVQRLTALIELASEEAAMQGREFGLRFGQDNYAFLDLDPNTGAWIELGGDDFLRPRALPDEAEFELWLEDRQILLDAKAIPLAEDPVDDEDDQVDTGPPPHVAILSSGEMTPFLLRFRRDFEIDEITLSGDSFGALEIDYGSEQ